MSTLPGSFSRRTIIFGTLAFLLVAIALVAPFFIHPRAQQPSKSTPKPAAYDKTTSRVFIKDLYMYGDYLNPQKQLAIETTLYAYVRASQPDATPDLYTGVIRKNSFLQTKDAKGVVITNLLVDIGPVGLTYNLQTTGTTKDGAMPVIIQCAPQDQQQTASITCVDGMQRRE